MPLLDEWLVAAVRDEVPEDAIEAIRAGAGDGPVLLWDQLVERGLLTDERVLQAVSARFRMPPADLRLLDPRVRETVPENLARRFGVVPLRLTDSHLDIATANPFDMDAEKMLAFSTGREVRVALASPSLVRRTLDELYRAEDEMAKLLGGLDSGSEVEELAPEEEEAASEDEASKAPIIRLVNSMLSDGIVSRASDIHVEPVEGGLIVRYRIDGVLRQQMKLPRTVGLPLVSRIKIMSGLDIADRRRPQDGRARLAIDGQPVDLRVSTLPAAHGEKVVIRILNQKSTLLSLEALGLFPDERQTITEMLGHKEGIVLVTGPTGSGKTTTLYSALRMIQGEGVNIVTVEDPVEYRLGENIVQVQVHEKAGLTFAAALRSILRQDPDVVLLGEIRDLETATTAIQASLTGHLVLSTLHTNDAPSAITRLVDMGVEAYKIASALRGVIAQRLMRRLCPTCKAPATEPPPAVVRPFLPAGASLVRGVGCPDCAMTGYFGRFSIVELLPVSNEFRRLVSSGELGGQIYAGARALGMKSLFDCGLRHVLAGESSVEELLRVTEPPHDEEPPTSRAAAAASAAPPATEAGPAVAEPPPRPARGAPLTRRLPAEPGVAEPEVDLGLELVDEIGDGTSLGTKGCVLLVEDEEHLRRVMRDLLEREGYKVEEARDGVEALDQIDRHAPDLIMLDLNLPNLDGYGVLAQLRSRPATTDIPVIVLTAKGDEDNEVRVFELGADDFLTKPFRARALSARLEAVLARRRGA